jgi:hypothetical protein
MIENSIYFEFKKWKNKIRWVRTVPKCAAHAHDTTPTWKWHAAPKRRQHSPLTHSTNIQKQG